MLDVFLRHLLVSAALVASPLRADIVVSGISPASNAVRVDPETAIRVTFSVPLDPSSLTAEAFYVSGRWSGVASGSLELSSDGRVLSFEPDQRFSAGERVTVYLARSLAALDGSTLGRGYAWQFWVASRPAEIELVESYRQSVRRPGELRIQTYGAHAGDFNGDGSTDLIVPNELSNDLRLFLNDGKGGYGSFEIFEVPQGAAPSTNETADFNRDGHLDFAVGNTGGSTIAVFLGDGAGSLTGGRAYSAGKGVRGLAVLEINGDGYPDIATANRDVGSVTILINDGDGTFPESGSRSIDTPGSAETAASAADMNGDGLLDLVIGSLTSADVQVLLADGRGGFQTHGRVSAGGGVWMIETGDVDGDGHVDVATANSSDNTVSILRGDGSGGLSLSSIYPSAFFPLAIDLGDIDGDGDLDMVSSNFGSGLSREPGSWLVFENEGDGTFHLASRFAASGAGSCAVLHDRDNDGTLDMTTVDELHDVLVMFSNTPIATSVESGRLPGREASVDIFPNPFRWTTSISGRTSRDRSARIEIFDVAGRLIRVLSTAADPTGRFRTGWDGRDATGRITPPGLYVIRVWNGPLATRRPLIRSGR